MKLEKLRNEDIQNMALRLNTMPRKVLGGLTPIEVYTREACCTYCLNPAPFMVFIVINE